MLAFLVYVFTLGQRAVRAGETGVSDVEIDAPVPAEAAQAYPPDSAHDAQPLPD